MQPVPRIFVSATSRDLRTARGLVSEGLRRMECLPIVQDDFPPDYKSVRDMLRTKISTCNAVVHLAGFYYGAEPQPVLPGPDRRSFTQMEYEIAMELKLPCYVFLCGKDFPFDPHDPEPEEKQQLQIAHRERLLQRDELFYEFASPDELANRTRELQLSVEGLRKELARERNRRRLAMLAAAAALVIAVVGGIWLHGRQQETEKVNVAQTSEIASLKAQLEGPWAIVNKVNSAMELMRQQKVGTEEEMKTAAIAMVAAETQKTPEQIQQAIDSSTELAQKLIAAARAEGEGDASKRAENRLLEAETYLKLAASHQAAANYADALAAYQKAYDLLDPKEHPEPWLDALCSIAEMEEELGREAEAAERYKEAVAFGEENPALGIGHSLTVFATNRLRSYLLYSSSDPLAAEQLMRRVVKLRTKALGPEDPETIRAKGELAEILATQGNFDEAATVASEALETSEKVFGEDSDVTIDIVNNLAGIFEEADRMDSAIRMKRRVLAHREETLGPDDKSTLATANTLAGMLKRSGNLDEASELYNRILTTRQEVLGPKHPDTLSSMEAIGGMLSQEKDFEGAESTYRKVLALREDVQGPEHPDTIDCLGKIARAQWRQDQLADAVETYTEVLALREKVQGPDHSDTVNSAWSLAAVLSQQQDYEAAAPLYLRVLEARKANPNEPATEVAAANFDLARTLEKLNRPEDALPFAKRAAAIAAEELPEDDEDRLSYESLVTVLTEATGGFPQSARPREVQP